MAISIIDIANVGSPVDDPTLLLPGVMFVPDPAVHPGPWHAVVGTVANTFRQSQNLTALRNIFPEFAAQGYICLAMFVRTAVNIQPGQTTDGKWHQQTDDLKMGVRYMRSDPGGFGYATTGLVATLGGSASAHHAMYMALDGTAGDDKADAAVCFSPPTDFSDRSGSNGAYITFISVVQSYGRSTDLTVLRTRSPIGLTLSTAKPILHFNGDNEMNGTGGMPLAQLTLFKLAILAAGGVGATGYSSIVNTGALGLIHSFGMWSSVKDQVFAWLQGVLVPLIPPPPPPPDPGGSPSPTPKNAVVMTVPLQAGTLLANVVYKWITNGVEGAELSIGITQPVSFEPVFRLAIVPPAGAEELIVYDKTDTTNWNPAGFKNVQQQQALPTQPFAGVSALATFRRTPFRRVFDAVVRLYGLNPRTQLPRDVALSVLEHINARVTEACLGIEWPEWTFTEERAFRQVWNAANQYYQFNAAGQVDEVFHIPTMKYWRVNTDVDSDPPLGAEPGGITIGLPWWIELTAVETYVSYDQPCKRSIGEVLTVYASDPRFNPCAGQLQCQPNENGIWILGGCGATVFIRYKMPIPQFTMEPFVTGKQYNRGDVIFDPDVNEVFQAGEALNVPPKSNPKWRFTPFLEKWYQFVRWGSYADGILELEQGAVIDPNALAKQAGAEAKAEKAFQQQVDSFSGQGRKMQWTFGRSAPIETLPWTGGTVVTLTDACESGMGWVYPWPPDPDI